RDRNFTKLLWTRPTPVLRSAPLPSPTSDNPVRPSTDSQTDFSFEQLALLTLHLSRHLEKQDVTSLALRPGQSIRTRFHPTPRRSLPVVRTVDRVRGRSQARPAPPPVPPVQARGERGAGDDRVAAAPRRPPAVRPGVGLAGPVGGADPAP